MRLSTEALWFLHIARGSRDGVGLCLDYDPRVLLATYTNWAQSTIWRLKQRAKPSETHCESILRPAKYDGDMIVFEAIISSTIWGSGCGEELYVLHGGYSAVRTRTCTCNVGTQVGSEHCCKLGK
ncbi:uncharacterized protein YALI1_C22278g [Yarrowia lipolytica]|uniref:Uncharacterized protein n=1 Tax=Yarrowia lipolytica TaxID=4952 RepID=A0A1D8NBC5_YARLL|nr:hypothetical protein YALI1_C22278g [Yarrowia lipolytica]